MSDPDQTPRGEYRTLPGRLRDSATQARAVDRAELLCEAAAELERMYIVIDAYCASSAAACREIKRLHER